MEVVLSKQPIRRNLGESHGSQGQVLEYESVDNDCNYLSFLRIIIYGRLKLQTGRRCADRMYSGRTDWNDTDHTG